MGRGDHIVIMTPGGGAWGTYQGKKRGATEEADNGSNEHDGRAPKGLHAGKKSGSLAEREAISLGA